MTIRKQYEVFHRILSALNGEDKLICRTDNGWWYVSNLDVSVSIDCPDAITVMNRNEWFEGGWNVLGAWIK